MPIVNQKWKMIVAMICGVALCLSSTTTSFAQKQNRQRRLPENVTASRNLEYAKVGEHALLLDLFVPKQEKVPPLLVWIHGGGWRAGNKGFGGRLLWLTGKGYAVASINYRLSDVAKFPAQIHDCKAAIRWLRAHAKEYGYDATRIGVAGGSAGGHLVALLGTSGGDKLLEGKVGEHLDQSSRVQAVCDFYGPTDFLQFDKHVLPNGRKMQNDPKSPVSQLFGAIVNSVPEKAKQGSPVNYVDASDPPFLIIHGNQDPVVAVYQSHLLNQALQKVRVPSSFHELAGASHGGPQFNSPKIQKLIEQFFYENIKQLKSPAEKSGDGFKPLFDRQLLSNFTIQGGSASYYIEGDNIVGTTTDGSPNTFLVTNRNYGDFELRFEVKCDPKLNSGVQIRSHVYEKDTPQASNPKRIREAGEVFGYQVEIVDNGMSGRIWDEGRHTRWHNPNDPTEQEKQAYKPGEWNKYRVLAKGNHIQTWVNDVPITDIKDDEDATGFIGLQVHSIKKGTGPYQVRWRKLQIRTITH